MTCPDHSAREAELSRRAGWLALLLWACFGAALEAAHGFKWAPYLDDPLARLLLRLAHAHGVGLALVLLAHAGQGAPLFNDDPRRGRRVGKALRLAAGLIPLGFALSAPLHSESDPAPPIALVPLGAILLFYALGELALAAVRAARR